MDALAFPALGELLAELGEGRAVQGEQGEAVLVPRQAVGQVGGHEQGQGGPGLRAVEGRGLDGQAGGQQAAAKSLDARPALRLLDHGHDDLAGHLPEVHLPGLALGPAAGAFLAVGLRPGKQGQKKA